MQNMAHVISQADHSLIGKEGFLCPVCLKDLGGASALAQHFDKAHEQDSGDVLRQFKGLVGKARKFFASDDDLCSDSTEEQILPAQTSSEQNRNYLPLYTEIQEKGVIRDLTDQFKSIRDASMDSRIMETNKLIIRLSKLTNDDGLSEVQKRKVFEKQTVPWADDSVATHCMTCGKKFTLTRRKHHCRLCGGIMCNPCSYFLSFPQAKSFTSGTIDGSTSQTASFGTRRGSNSSLNSIGLDEGASHHLRVCAICRELLERHKAKQQLRSTKPQTVIYYEQIQSCIESAEKMTPEYVKMAESLLAGETIVTLEVAESFRQRISKLYGDMDNISKRIVNHGINEQVEITQKEMKLRLNIRAFVVAYIQEHSIQLPKLPEEKELKALVEQRDEQRTRKVKQELREAEESGKRLDRNSTMKGALVDAARRPPAKEKIVDRVTSDGWRPGVDMHSVEGGVEGGDPMIQQMSIIRGYLKQAKQAQRWDEADMLEENLKQLEEEFYRTDRV